MIVLDVEILWLCISASLLLLMQAQALQLAKTNRELASSDCALRARNNELQDANGRLSELDSVKNRFLANFSNELRTPLSAILSGAKLLGCHHEHNPSLVQHLGEVIKGEGEQLSRLIEALPSRGQAEHRSLEWGQSKVTASQALRDAVTSIHPIADAQSVSIETDISDGLSLLWADHDRLVHALILLLDNAVTYTPTGGFVTALVRALGPEIVFSVVQHTGPPVPAGDLETILAKTGGSESDRRQAYGDGNVGFGLTVCRHIIESHNGRFWIEPPQAEGAIFSVAFSAIDYEPQAAAYVSHSDPVLHARAPMKRPPSLDAASQKHDGERRKT